MEWSSSTEPAVKMFEPNGKVSVAKGLLDTGEFLKS
jgi:hypothetical protein